MTIVTVSVTPDSTGNGERGVRFGLARVRVSDGNVEILTVPSGGGGDVEHVPGTVLPDGRTLLFEIVHTYCIGDLCFQILKELSLALTVLAPSETVVEPIDPPIVGPVEPEAPPQWPPIVPIAFGIVLVSALVLARWVGRRWWIVLMLVAVVGGGIGLGLRFGQDQQAQSIGAVLCTYCVGIEEAPRRAPSRDRWASAKPRGQGP